MPILWKIQGSASAPHQKVHKKETAVEHGLKGGAYEQREMFKMLKCSGILKHNIAGRKDAVLQRERKSKNSGSTVVGDSCHYLPHIVG